MMLRESFSPPLAALVVAAACTLPATPARADRVFFNSGNHEVLEGIVQEEFPTRIRFVFESRVIVIPRNRIAKIELDSGVENIKILLDRCEQCLIEGDVDQARLHLAEARDISIAESAFLEDVQAMETKLDVIVAEGRVAERRLQADKYLAEARDYFNVIRNQKGVETLIKGLEVDPTHAGLHDQMGTYLGQYRPPIDFSTQYFCQYVADPLQLKPEHPIIALLPQILGNVVKHYRGAQTAEVIQKQSDRLAKISKAFADSPAWVESASTHLKNLINQGSDGIIADRIRDDLDGRDYQLAMDRLTAWKRADADPSAAILYARTWIGLGDLARATAVLEATLQKAPDDAEIAQHAEALNQFQTAFEAIESGDHAVAKDNLDQLFEIRDALVPEIYQLVIDAKIGYDIADMQALEASDPTKAADLTLHILEYSPDEATAQTARETFSRVALQLSYQLHLQWIVDGHRIPIHKESTDILATLLGEKFSLKFDPQSPFSLIVNIRNSTRSLKGKKVLEAAQQADPYNNDWLVDEDHDFAKSMDIQILIQHPLKPSFLDITDSVKAPAAGTTLSGVDRNSKAIIFFDITSLVDFDRFLEADLGFYLKPEWAIIGNFLTP